MKCCGLPRLSVDRSIQTKGSRNLEIWGCHWRGACAVDPGVQHDCWSQGGVYLLQVFTGLASVSSRAYRLPAPQTDAEASTACSSSGKLSTVLSMILPRTITMSQQLQRSGGGVGGVQWRNDGKYPIIWSLKAVWKLIAPDIILLC